MRRDKTSCFECGTEIKRYETECSFCGWTWMHKMVGSVDQELELVDDAHSVERIANIEKVPEQDPRVRREYPCIICHGKKFEWGRISQTVYRADSALLFGGEVVVARKCMSCGNLQTFVRGDE